MPDLPKKRANSPDGDEDADLDPIEVELIAYLDGELDHASAQRMEETLAGNPALRARADALQRSYSLLDYLPKTEPSATFATRTIDRLPRMKAQTRPMEKAQTAVTPNPSLPDASVSRASASAVLELPTPHRWGLIAGLALATIAALFAGYFLTGAVHRPDLTATSTAQVIDTSSLESSIVKNFYRYAIVDDFEFLSRSLASTDFFGEGQAVEWDVPGLGKSPPPESLSDPAREQIAREFLALPAERQEKIRQIDRHLQDLKPAPRTSLNHVLDNYAAWFYGLPDNDRKEILAAATPQKRLDAIRDVSRRRWLASLPIEQQKNLRSLPALEREQLIPKMKLDEERHRALWQIPKVVVDAHRLGEASWPFNEKDLREKVLEFTKHSFHPEDATRSRLTPLEQNRLRVFLNMAQSGESYESAWLGHLLHDYFRIESGHPRFEMLPEPATGKPITEPAELPTDAKRFYDNRKLEKKLTQLSGKWPDFALGLWDEYSQTKLKAKGGITMHLGPARPDEFKTDLRLAVVTLQGKLTSTEFSHLKQLEGKWPEYPRELVKLARIHDLSLPGIMLPGSPQKWDRTYRHEKTINTKGVG